MWLLNAKTLKLRAFVEKIPDYVILSHTWNEEEVTFDDIEKPHALDMAGYKKIAECCSLAVRDGFEWVWIDTCCIDKRSSAELSEAINSMYKWYWEAAICYAFLSDVSAESPSWMKEIESSRWFTRGWTLQELLAPDIVEFYDKDWQILGTKSKLIIPIRSATKIQRNILLDRAAIRTASIATKFSWAARRQTTRIEDMAYCLLGLVQVNMPMLYGEGGRAFYRLQSEIIRQTNEHTIFAWESTENDWQTSSLLAPSPRYFEHCWNMRRTTLSASIGATHEITNNGLRITLPCIAVSEDRTIALLDCVRGLNASVGIWLERLGGEKWQKLPGSRLVTISETDKEDAELQNMHLIMHTTYDEPSVHKPSSVTVRSVLTDQPCSVTGIAISTSRNITLVQMFQDYTVPLIERRRFLYRDVTVREGQAACLTLQVGIHSLSVVCGLRNDRAAICVATQPSLDRNWAEEMRINWSGHWTQVSDYDHVLLPDTRTMVQISAKRSLAENEVLWKLDVRVFRCSCRAAKGGDCVCEAEIRRKGVLRCINSQDPECPCEFCTQACRKDK